MKVSEFSAQSSAGDVVRPSFISRGFRASVFRLLDSLVIGEIRVREVWERGERDLQFGNPAADGLASEIIVHSPQVYADIATRGSIGAAEAYMRGFWSTPDLVSVVRVFARNIDVIDAMEHGLTRFVMQIMKAGHIANRNTVGGSRRNISAHYDLSNEFFELFLDPKMMYSSAIFATPDQDLDSAAENKLAVVVDKLDLSPDTHLLEIGTGWGGLAIYAARHTGCRVTTTTISKEQHAHAVTAVAAAGLDDRVTVLLEDYRNLTGKFDRLVSIEMIEAVGHAYLGTYFEKCASLLKADGIMVLQAITMAEHRSERARKNVDFIQKYIFPGGSLPSLADMTKALSTRTTLQPVHIENLPLHYAQTLKIWRERFMNRTADVSALGFDSTFLRMWEYYLAYCEGGFREGTTGLMQLVLAGPRAVPDATRIR